VDAKFNARVKRIIALAEEQARAHNQDFVGVEHILLGLLDEGEGIATKTLESRGISIDAVRQATERAIAPGSRRPYGQLALTRQADRALDFSRQEAAALGAGSVGTEPILLGLLKERDGIAARVLHGLGLSLNLARDQVIEFTRGRQGRPAVGIPGPRPRLNPGPPPKTPGRVSKLDRFGRNLTAQAAAGMLYPAVGRDQEIAKVARALAANSSACPLLIGDIPGQLTVLEGLAQRIAAGNAPRELAGKQLYYSDPDGIGAEIGEDGIDAVGAINSVPGVLSALFAETRVREDVILAVGKLPTMAADPQVRRALASDIRRIIGTVDPDYYRQDVTVNGAFYREFQAIELAGRLTAYDIGKLEFELRAVTYG
jgi:ATP-dependent Clp protease ATP-binding subunit ClpC